MNKFRKDTTIGISKALLCEVREHIPKKTSVSGFIEEALKEKIYRERLHGNPILERAEKLYGDNQCG